MDNEKYYCWANNCENEIEKPISCCSGFECGCMGLPIDPPFCSHECEEEYYKNRDKNYKGLSFNPED